MIYRMAALRLRWYGEATAQLLRRRWQLIVLLIGLLSVPGDALVVVLSRIVLAPLNDQHGVLWRLGAIGLWQGCWFLWALMQLDQLRGGHFRDYAQSLPLSRQHWRWIDLQVLLVADTPLLLAFIAAAYVLLGAHVPFGYAAAGGLFIAFLLSTQLACQLAALNGNTRSLVYLLLIDSWVAYALGLSDTIRCGMLALATAVGVLALMTPLPSLVPRGDALLRPLQHIVYGLTRYVLSWLPQLMRVSLAILYRQHASNLLGKFFYCVLVVFAAEGLMSIWQYDHRSLPMGLIAAGFIAMSVSELFRDLKMAHDAALPFTAALPMRQRWAVPGDMFAVLSFGYPFILVMSWTLWLHDLSLPRTTGFIASFAALVLLLRLPQLLSNQNAVLSSLIVTALWTIAIANIL